MKALFDIAYTNRPEVCSTSYLVWDVIEHMIAQRDDFFAYVLYPPQKMEAASWKFMQRHKDRVTLLPLVQSTRDRLSEMYMLRNGLRFYLNPWNTHCWDADIIVSSRTPVLKHMQVHSCREYGNKAMPRYRMFIGLEEMPVLPFRDTVKWHSVLYPDTLATYGLVDAVMIQNQWTKALLKPYLRDVFSAAWAKRILDNMHEVVPVKLQRLMLKKQYTDGDPFNVTFVGRITGTRNFHAVADLFRKQFSYPIGKNKAQMQFLISTNTINSFAVDYGELDFVDTQHNNREEFHRFLQEAHVAINLSTVEDFSLSTYETLLAGVPTIVADEPWSMFLGPDYPFRVKNQTEAYALLNQFAADYRTMYNKFRFWESTYWKTYVEDPKRNTTTGERVHELTAAFEARVRGFLSDRALGEGYGQVIDGLPVQDGLIDLNPYLAEAQGMYDEVEDDFSLSISQRPNSHMLKLMAQQRGFVDTNHVGIMRKP